MKVEIENSTFNVLAVLVLVSVVFFINRSCRHTVQICNYFASGSWSAFFLRSSKKNLYMQIQARFESAFINKANAWFRIRVTVISWERSVNENKIMPGFSYWYMLKMLFIEMDPAWRGVIRCVSIKGRGMEFNIKIWPFESLFKLSCTSLSI